MPPKKRKSAKKTPSAKKPSKKDTLTTALQNNADRSRYTVGDLKKVYERGVAAYLSSGSRNTSVGAWSMGRVSSFVSGDVSFFTLSLAILLIFNKQSWNIFAYAAIILISLLRIMEGDHFLSDTIMSFIITYVVIRVLYDLFQLLPEDLNLKRKTKLKRT